MCGIERPVTVSEKSALIRDAKVELAMTRRFPKLTVCVRFLSPEATNTER
jgi:hypothetical protein